MPALYHMDPYQRAFEAKVLSCEPAGEGKWAVLLSDTCFYPTGGGQPCDLGMLDDTPVLDVSQADEDGPIYHLLPSPLPVGKTVHGAIDWARRYDHMQQHTGQHILSHAVYERFQGYSLGLHVGEKDGYVDIQTELENLSDELKKTLEADCDAIIAANYPVRQFFPTREELAALPLRKVPPEHLHLRIVSFGPEAVACCGTHLACTSEARLVRITGCAHSHNNLRIFFVAGERAVRHAQLCMDQAEGTAAELSCGIPDLKKQVLRLKFDLQQRQRELAAAQRELALLRLEGAQVHELAACTAIVEQTDGFSMRQLQESAAALCGKRAQLVCLLSPADKGVQAVLASAGPDAAALFRGLAARFAGRGGGRPDFAQGLLQGATRDGVLSALKELAP